VIKITLKAARINAGYTLKSAAEKFGVHHETVSNYEHDSTNVPRSFFIKLPEVYGIPTENIYFGKQSEYLATLKQTEKLQQA
jgi:transcriptional regulator with XRE-family HTH domain